jgi:hypothetical protein
MIQTKVGLLFDELNLFPVQFLSAAMNLDARITKLNPASRDIFPQTFAMAHVILMAPH